MRAKILTIIITAVALQGCIYVDDTPHNEPDAFTKAPTIGQELLDLGRALESGVISNEEYDRLKSRIIDGRR